jgi:hypothetical protein
MHDTAHTRTPDPGRSLMKIFLKILFAGIFLWMIVMTAHVQSHRSILLSPGEFSWQTSPWACATIFDAYFGFTTFFVWVCFKERTLWARLLWFLLIMSLGNIAMSGYVLLQLFRLREDEPASAILDRR